MAIRRELLAVTAATPPQKKKKKNTNNDNTNHFTANLSHTYTATLTLTFRPDDTSCLYRHRHYSSTHLPTPQTLLHVDPHSYSNGTNSSVY